MKRFLKTTFLFLIMALLAVQPVVTYAMPSLDLTANSSLIIHYENAGVKVKGAKFDVYKVASRTNYSEFTVTSQFASYPVELGEMDQAEWQELAYTLKGYAQADNLTPGARVTTNSDGTATINSMKPGLYLVVGHRATVDNYVYTCNPFLVALPGNDETDWLYSVSVYPKSDREENPPDDDSPVYVTRKVLKVWKDSGNELMRPTSITVQLLCDGEVYDEQILRAANNWRYSWDNLDGRKEWTVVEKAVSGYTTRVTKEGITFTIKNTYKNPSTETTSYGNKLTQSGVLWWPVFPLAGAGLLFVVVGIFRRKGENYD